MSRSVGRDKEKIDAASPIGAPHASLDGENHRFMVLDALRGVAACSVMLYHYSAALFFGLRGGWFPNAYLAVDFFFVLSGFVIAFAYETRLLNGLTFSEFTKIRLIRLYPLYGLAIASTAIGMMTANLAGLKLIHLPALFLSLLLGLFFIPTPFPWSLTDNPISTFFPHVLAPYVFPLNPPSWTLSLEIAINLFFAAISKRLSTTVLLGLNVFGYLVIVALGLHYMSFEIGFLSRAYAGGWARVLWSFFIGVVLFRFLRADGTKLPPIAGVLLAVFLTMDFAYGRPAFLYGSLNIIVILPLAVWIGARTAIWERWRAVYSWLGQISYALYIVHMPLLFLLLVILKHYALSPTFPLFLAWLVVTLFVTSLIHRVYDVPLRSFLKRKFLIRDPLSRKEGTSAGEYKSPGLFD